VPEAWKLRQQRLIDTPQFPAEWKAGALAQAEALETFRPSSTDVDWTYLSPPVIIE
jgi:putative NADH-flavin reductase